MYNQKWKAIPFGCKQVPTLLHEKRVLPALKTTLLAGQVV